MKTILTITGNAGPSRKFQAPTSKLQRNLKNQTSRHPGAWDAAERASNCRRRPRLLHGLEHAMAQAVRFGAWCLELLWSLVLGAWSFRCGLTFCLGIII